MIRIDVSTITKIVEQYLLSLNFSKKHTKYITDNLIEAELNGKSSHGVGSLLNLPRFIESGSIKVDAKPKTRLVSNFLHFDSTNISGYISMSASLQKSISILDKGNDSVVLVGIKNMSYSPGYIGAYARKAAEKGYFFLGFSKSPRGVVPHGGVKGVFGTNPITFSMPYKDSPVLVDTSVGKINLSTLLAAEKSKSELPKNVAVDQLGNATTSASDALLGGILPIAEHKGSSFAFISEILAGAFIDSPIFSLDLKDPKWGYFYMIGKTNLFLNDKSFENNVEKLMKKHKESGLSNRMMFYPGERASSLRNEALRLGKIKVDNLVLKKIKERIK